MRQRKQALRRQWQRGVFGAVMACGCFALSLPAIVASLPMSQAQAQAQTPPQSPVSASLAQAEALAAAGDVNGAAAVVASLIDQGADPQSVVQSVSRANPNVAGAILNQTVRNVAQTRGSAQLGTTIQSMVAGAVSGVLQTGGAGGPADPNAPTAAVLAENIAVNVRQAIVVVSGGSQNTTNLLLASARAGVNQVTPPPTGPTTETPGTGAGANQQALDSLSGQLTGILNSRLTPGISAEEQTDANNNNNNPDPIVIVQTPVVETPVVQTPVVETPVQEESVVIIPVVTEPVNVFTDDVTSEDNASQN
ncbi:MAG: hypothetical protein ACPGOY_17045 [Rhodospirillaceae bacterium]